MKLATESVGAQEEHGPARGAANALAYRPLRILIADDCESNLLLVQTILHRWDIVPTTARNGEQAAELAEKQTFDLILMDIVMPVLDGVSATARIREFERGQRERPAVPIVAYTSLDMGSSRLSLSRLGLSAVLPKPCSATSLRLCLERWCPERFFAG